MRDRKGIPVNAHTLNNPELTGMEGCYIAPWADMAGAIAATLGVTRDEVIAASKEGRLMASIEPPVGELFVAPIGPDVSGEDRRLPHPSTLIAGAPEDGTIGVVDRVRGDILGACRIREGSADG